MVRNSRNCNFISTDKTYIRRRHIELLCYLDWENLESIYH
jgi:hypothetical protein